MFTDTEGYDDAEERFPKIGEQGAYEGIHGRTGAPETMSG